MATLRVRLGLCRLFAVSTRETIAGDIEEGWQCGGTRTDEHQCLYSGQALQGKPSLLGLSHQYLSHYSGLGNIVKLGRVEYRVV